MAAAAHSSRHSKPTASTTTSTRAAASNSSQSQSQDDKNQAVSSTATLSPSPLASLPTGSRNGQGAASSSNSQRPQSLNGSPTTTSLPGSPKSAGLFAFAAAAFSGLSEPRLRPRQSLTRLYTGLDSAPGPGRLSPERSSRHRATLSNFSSSSALLGEGKSSGSNPPSKPYSETDPTRPLPIHVSRLDEKMHQTSSRLLRMTDDDRPFTKVRTRHRRLAGFRPGRESWLVVWMNCTRGGTDRSVSSLGLTILPGLQRPIFHLDRQLIAALSPPRAVNQG